ncbi:MAG: response regulator [Gammaproteobacteria bacterium]|jgi:chemotaxis response regulator CheB|nr:response regulator [Gammaproteobacteria bacterium]
MSNKTVMIVDDSTIMRAVIGDMLKGVSGLEVVATAANGKDALKQLGKVRPDLILLDIEMPEMDGLEFLRHVRLKSRARVIVLSSVTPMGSNKAVQARMLGADGLVSKPSGAVSYDLEQKRGSELVEMAYRVLGIAAA